MIPFTSPFSRSTRFPHRHRFAARAPCDSKGSECQCGIHTAEAASALRSRKTERAAKEKPTPISQFFLAPAAPHTPTRRHAPGRLSTPPPLPENLLLGLHKKLPSAPLRAPRRFRNPKIGQQLGAQPTPGFRVILLAEIDVKIDAMIDVEIDAEIDVEIDSRSGRSLVSIPNSSPFSRSTRFPFTSTTSPPRPLRFERLRMSGSECGIHTAEAASALRSRKTERAAKEKPMQPHNFFKHLPSGRVVDRTLQLNLTCRCHSARPSAGCLPHRR